MDGALLRSLGHDERIHHETEDRVKKKRERKSCLSRFRCTLGRNEKKMEIVYDDEKTTMTHDDFQSQLKRAISPTRLISLLLCAALPFNTFSTDDELQLFLECASAFSRLLRLNLWRNGCRQAAPDYSCPLSQFLAICDNFLLSLIAILFFRSISCSGAHKLVVLSSNYTDLISHIGDLLLRARMVKPERCVKF